MRANGHRENFWILDLVRKRYNVGMKLWRKWELLAVGGVILLGIGYTRLGNSPSPRLGRVMAEGKINDPCHEVAGDHRDCYDVYFDKVVAARGPKEGLRQLRILSQGDKAVEADCHPMVHNIGHAGLKYYKNDVTKALADANEVCASGYYHGVLESYMADFNDSQLEAQLPKICHHGDREYTSSYYSCIHGLGHGLTIRFEMDVFKALPYCDHLNDRWETQSCFGGVFMQNIVADLQPKYHKSVDLKPEDPVYPCNAIREDQKSQCYGMVSSYILRVNEWNYDRSFAVCDRVESAYVATCYQSMGRDISGTALLDPAQVIANCNKSKAELRQNCFIGAAKNAVYNDGSVANADKLCAAVDVTYQASCRAARDEIASTL